MNKRRVVVTGIGMVTPIGLNVYQTWNNILLGKSGVSLVNEFDTSKYTTKIWAKVKNFNIGNYIPLSESKKMDLFTQFGMVAAIEAIKDSKLVIDDSISYRTGVSVGAGIGGIETIIKNQEKLIKYGPRKISPFFIPSGIINILSGQISIKYKLKGPNIAISTACTTGTHNIGIAFRMISYGDADLMICGGSEMTTNPLCLAGFSATRSLSKRNNEPEKASRPWDKDRDGFVIGEGSGILILEELNHAINRGASIYAEIIGFGMSGDAYHITAPDKKAEGFLRSMLHAIKDAKIDIEQIDYINAHGTSTYLNDLYETKAIKKLFKNHAYNLAVSSTKSMTGHLLGATGAVEAIFTILAIKNQIAPPTINLDYPDKDCDLNYVAHKPQKRIINFALSNSFGFGGTNGSLLFKKV
ncbi:beta-ketoacyl-ACP synthase II [Candidatus Legionella polyplacis]|uniref:3-oxoacyl-[acyl-carrier-protein] synthase 2 n=1 Tax=Candidatus Legionella polyplacis TaxID=2005262 RepID=A0ABZ2H1C3_9GAMM